MRTSRQRRWDGRSGGGAAPRTRPSRSCRTAASRTGRWRSNGRTAARGASRSAPAGNQSWTPSASSRCNPSALSLRCRTRRARSEAGEVASGLGASRMTTPGAASGRQKTGVSSAPSRGSTQKAQPPAGRGPASRIGRGAAALAPDGGLMVGTIGGIAAQELPGEARGARGLERRVVGLAAPVTRRHNGPACVGTAWEERSWSVLNGCPPLEARRRPGNWP
jgi:hypothetical protein